MFSISVDPVNISVEFGVIRVMLLGGFYEFRSRSVDTRQLETGVLSVAQAVVAGGGGWRWSARCSGARRTRRRAGHAVLAAVGAGEAGGWRGCVQ